MRCNTSALFGDFKVGLENIGSCNGEYIETDTVYEGKGPHFDVGDILYGKLRPYLAKVWIAEFPGQAVGDFFVFKSKRECNHFIKYVLLNSSCVNLINSFTYGAKMPRVNWTDMGNVYIPIPPLDEQKRIAAFLSTKTSLIDELRRKKESELQLLDELKQAEIANVVTRGLNPDVPMKDSGIPWIGKIPSNWEVKKVRSLFALRNEKGSDKEFQPLSVSKDGVTHQLENAVKTDNGDNRKIVRVGDFVVNSRSDRKGACGFSQLEGSVSLINIVCFPITELNSEYFHFVFRSNNYIEEFYRNGRGIVSDLWTTKYEDMRNIFIPIPPLSEQKAIAEYIEHKTHFIDNMIANLKSEIDYLTEYKQRLIADAVTGQIKID
jgi:restriction endonuclease S subunit